MQEKLKNAFADMTAETDSARVKRNVTEQIQKEICGKTRSMPGKRILRIAAVCAAVLVLSVTVYAAAVKYLSVHMSENGEYDYLVKVTNSDGTARVDRDALQELEALAIDTGDGNRVSKTFDTWAEAADWLDCGLLISDLMTEADTEWGRVILTAYADGEGKLSTLSLTGSTVVTDTGESCTVCVNIPLEAWGEKYDLVMGFGPDTHSGRTAESVEYITPAGIQAEIVDVVSLAPAADGSTDSVYDTTLHIFHEGILYQISIGGRHTESQAELAKAIADSLQ